MKGIILKNGTVITPYRMLKNCSVIVEGGKIKGVEASKDIGSAENYRVIDVKGSYIVPGFIDIHIHGGGGFDFMEGTAEAIKGIADFHVKYGTTAMVLSTSCTPMEQLYRTLDTFREVKTESKGSKLLGVHLEGPFLSPAQKGAMPPEFIICPKEEDIKRIISYKDVVIRVTAAPEIEGGLELARKLRVYGILMSIGHSDATYEDVLKALESGYTHVTHFYSATSMVRRVNAYRISGIIEAGYHQDGLTVEIIGDGHHLPADLLSLIYKIKGPDKTALITDAICAAGLAEGQSLEGSGGKKIIVEDGVAKLPDRSAFAGSVSTMNRVVKNMIHLADVPIHEAIKMASTTPARILGIGNRKGIIDKGMDADIVVMDRDFNVKATIVEGEVRYDEIGVEI